MSHACLSTVLPDDVTKPVDNRLHRFAFLALEHVTPHAAANVHIAE